MTRRPTLYVALMAVVAVVALAPIAFNYVVDAYDRNGVFDLGLDKSEISVKAHYPLYKMIEYPRIKAPTVVLGDSRARALQDRYWQELGNADVYNFAYGGATVFEIYDTFKYLTENSELETLIVSLPLRSMDARFKGGMNRVPEAIELAADPFGYYSNWFVAKIGWRLLEDRFPQLSDAVKAVSLNPVSAAKAAEFAALEHLGLEELLDPELCEDCKLQAPHTTLTLPAAFHHRGLGLGRWGRYWPEITLDRDLPKLFAKQVGTNGAADWRRFKQSDELWSMVEEISAWCDANDVELIFVIPPTISEMQRRISDFGLQAANHRFRERLSALGPVVDFDFDDGFTRELDNFTDAYHFNARAARKIVGELQQLIEADQESRALAQERRGDLVCPIQAKDVSEQHSDGTLQLIEGNSCRIWRRTDA
ncbi:hypothetical protein JM93_02959 [Roseibium hamelinense]|uniref:Uncharacterized protein n=1 Tax=Roseibium hamelinense TaxID=150831 RepID=A0A562STK3_9HYPH|nr:hypothetical protein [Roseibium hamelinense]MTI43070.1 hypothetical protein [Roseibium hamelinense]TWI84627.1 hypothetical protein JM93_02959 [Roseibium hamelinense]